MIRLITLTGILLLVACGEPPVPVAAVAPLAAIASDVEILVAGPAVIRETLTLYGSIKANAEREQSVRARYPGVVREIFKRPGDRIARGEPLLTIESNDSLEPYTIAAPMDGTVLERHANAGESVDASMGLFRIGDLSTVWAEFAVFPRDLSRVRPGLRIDIRAGDSDLAVSAKLNFIAAAGRADSQSVLARAQFANSNNRWVAGQFVTGEVIASETHAQITVAASAIQTLNTAPTVFVQMRKGFEPRSVRLGQRDGTTIEILEGMKAGEKYAGKNSYLIKADLLNGTSP